MEITATEFKNNLGKYLDMASTEDVVITKNGKSIARLTSGAETMHTYSDDTFLQGLKMLREPNVQDFYNAEPPGEWLLTCNGEPMARLMPVKRKRRLGFIDGPPSTEESIAALFEPIMTEEEIDEWENKPI